MVGGQGGSGEGKSSMAEQEMGGLSGAWGLSILQLVFPVPPHHYDNPLISLWRSRYGYLQC